MISQFVQIATAIGVVLNGVAALLAWWQSRRNGRALDSVKEQTDGINSRLVRVTGESEFAKGLKQGQDESEVRP